MTHYSIIFRTLSNDLIGIVVQGERDGQVVSRMNYAAVRQGALMTKLNEIRRHFLAIGITEAR